MWIPPWQVNGNPRTSIEREVTATTFQIALIATTFKVIGIMIIFIIINIKRDVAATTFKTVLNFMTFEMIFIIIFILSCSGKIDRKSSSLCSIRHNNNDKH